jgi:hypothetical protein
MPIEIRELIIRAYIEDAQDNSSGPTVSEINKEELVAECVQQVFQILREKAER